MDAGDAFEDRQDAWVCGRGQIAGLAVRAGDRRSAPANCRDRESAFGQRGQIQRDDCGRRLAWC